MTHLHASRLTCHVSRVTCHALWLLPLLLAGFWLRLSYLLGSTYFYDEFISMLAARIVAERGWPILPSGLFYDHGLLLSYLSGAFMALLGFSEMIARWPVLLLSVFTIAAYYTAARRLFDSPLAGLLAATLATLDEVSIIWGTRARMYTPAHLFVLLSLTWLLLGTLKHPAPRTRYLGLAFLAAAFFSHTMTFLILPPLALLLLIFTALYRRDWLRQPRLWQEAGVALAIVVLALVVVANGMNKPGAKVVTQPDPALLAPPPLGLAFLQGFVGPGLAWTRFDNLVGFFEEPPYDWLVPVITVALLVTLYRLWRPRRYASQKVVRNGFKSLARTSFGRKSRSPLPDMAIRHELSRHALRSYPDFATVALLFLALFVALIVFEMGALLTDPWSKSRYVFIPALPAFLLLSAGSLACLGQGVIELGSKLSRPRGRRIIEGLVALAGVGLIVALWGPAAWGVAQARSTGDYNTAFAYVREQWQPGDGVMTTHPAAAYLYLGRCDYYANQVSASVFRGEGEDDSLLDRYTGSPLIDTVDKLNTLLASGQRVWFVVDALRLYERFEPFFTQQIFAQMDVVRQTGATYVFLSRPFPTPLPAEPLAQLDANFGNVIHLGGYSLDPATIAPDGTASLGLYWRPTGTPSRPFKVFVQLRDGQGQTIAQSDHFLLEGLLTLEVWNALQQRGEWLRDSADLRLPFPLPADNGPYRLYLGFYDPNTLERVPLVNDTSGENAAVIELPDLPPTLPEG